MRESRFQVSPDQDAWFQFTSAREPPEDKGRIPLLIKNVDAQQKSAMTPDAFAGLIRDTIKARHTYFFPQIEDLDGIETRTQHNLLVGDRILQLRNEAMEIATAIHPESKENLRALARVIDEAIAGLLGQQAKADSVSSPVHISDRDRAQMATLLGTKDVSGDLGAVTAGQILTGFSKTMNHAASAMKSFVDQTLTQEFEKSELYKLQAKIKAATEHVELVGRYIEDASQFPDAFQFQVAFFKFHQAFGSLASISLTDKVWQKIADKEGAEDLSALDLELNQLVALSTELYGKAGDIVTRPDCYVSSSGRWADNYWPTYTSAVETEKPTADNTYPGALKDALGADAFQKLEGIDKALDDFAAAVRLIPSGSDLETQIVEQGFRAQSKARRELFVGARRSIIQDGAIDAKTAVERLFALADAWAVAYGHLQSVAKKPLPVRSEPGSKVFGNQWGFVAPYSAWGYTKIPASLEDNGFVEPPGSFQYRGRTYTAEELQTAANSFMMSGPPTKPAKVELEGQPYEAPAHSVRVKGLGEISGTIVSDLDWSGAKLNSVGKLEISDVRQPIAIEMGRGQLRRVEHEHVLAISADPPNAKNFRYNPLQIHFSFSNFAARRLATMIDQGDSAIWNQPRYDVSQTLVDVDRSSLSEGIMGAVADGQLEGYKVRYMMPDQDPVELEYWIERNDGEAVNAGWLKDPPELPGYDFTWSGDFLWTQTYTSTVDQAGLEAYVASVRQSD